ncbi:MAG: ABC transporter ATP-binding protein [Cetobacterium sp.]|uniref:ABC transporter ATP-binding protein n=1 Tax=Cetobacterium sp. TaxID=2071632 RepID=UPI0025FFB459|nr:ABC transporter ATP-binding protein [uncultured Cetobacterium sp.]
MNSLELKKIKYSYTDKDILKDINYKFFEGELVGILGANGCGKSTLLKVIMGFLDKENGEILLNEKNVNDYSRKEFAKKVAFITQHSSQNLNFTVLETLRLGRVPHIKNSFKGLDLEDEEIVQSVIKLLNLEGFLNRDINTLSGGEFQRVLLGRAFIQEGDVLLLDEPTSALDINYSLEFLELLKERILKRKLIGLIVIHDINLASIFCDKIIFIKDGKIAFSGKPKDVIKKKTLEEVYRFKPVVLEVDNEIYVLPKRRLK